MKPEAPPSSKAIRSTLVKSSNGTPADSTAQRPVEHLGEAATAGGRAGVFQFQ